MRKYVLTSIIATVLVIALFATLSIVRSAQAFSGPGDGTSNNPYIISDCVQLQAMNEDPTGYYILNNDIDCSATATWNSGDGFVPIGNFDFAFTGSFDGKNHTITGLFMNYPTQIDYPVGLFGYVDSSAGFIMNVYLANADLTGSSNVGGIGGVIVNTHIKNVRTDSSTTITGSDTVGGLIGEADASYIEESANYATVTGVFAVGGLIGRMEQEAIYTSFSSATVIGDENVGGLVGMANGNGINNTYVTGSVQGRVNVGGIIGRSGSTSGLDFHNSYTNASVTGTGSLSATGGLIGQLDLDNSMNGFMSISDNFVKGPVNGNARTAAVVGDYRDTNNDSTAYIGNNFYDLATTGQNTCDPDELIVDCNGVNAGSSDPTYFYTTTNDPLSNWNFTSPWIAQTGALPLLETTEAPLPALFAGGTGLSGNPYQITTCEALQQMQLDLTAYYELTSDVDCSDSATWNAGKGFKPVGSGTGAGPFTGNFNGNNHTINYLSIIRADDDPTTVDNANNEEFVGLFGLTNNATIANLNIAHAKVKGLTYVGGIVGRMGGGTLSNSTYNASSVDNDCTDAAVDGGECVWNAYGTYGGGLVGYAQYATITDSHTGGPVQGNGDTFGGLVGSLGTGSTLTDSYSTSPVRASASGGGAVGRANGASVTLARVHAAGDVTVTQGDAVGTTLSWAGGLIGYITSATVTESYATGAVYAEAGYAGGFAGSSDVAIISDSYATGDVSGSVSIGGFIGELYGGTYTNTYASGAVTGTDIGVGGYVGSATLDNDSALWYSFATGQVTSTEASAGFAGRLDLQGSPDFTYNFYDKTSTGAAACALDTSYDPIVTADCTAVNTDGTQSTYFYDENNPPFLYVPLAVYAWNVSDMWKFSGTALPILYSTMTEPVVDETLDTGGGTESGGSGTSGGSTGSGADTRTRRATMTTDDLAVVETPVEDTTETPTQSPETTSDDTTKQAMEETPTNMTPLVIAGISLFVLIVAYLTYRRLRVVG